ncbi:MAG: hypothetical protein VXA40_04640 [Gammaproteobacteria bacterium]
MQYSVEPISEQRRKETMFYFRPRYSKATYSQGTGAMLLQQNQLSAGAT